MRVAVASETTAVDLVAEFEAAGTRSEYGRALAGIGNSSRFTDDERGDIARAITRCWGRVAQL
jgi:hypothetical protein